MIEGKDIVVPFEEGLSALSWTKTRAEFTMLTGSFHVSGITIARSTQPRYSGKSLVGGDEALGDQMEIRAESLEVR